MNRFPRLNNFPDQAPKEELAKYVEELIKWASEAEDKCVKTVKCENGEFTLAECDQCTKWFNGCLNVKKYITGEPLNAGETMQK